MIAVAAGVLVTLHAMGEQSSVFQNWAGQACVGTNPTCSLVPNLATTDIHAKFHAP